MIPTTKHTTSTSQGRRKALGTASSLLIAAWASTPGWAQAAKAAKSLPSETSSPSPESAALKPGQFIWQPEIAPDGPLVVLVSLDEQRAYVYRDGKAIGISTISSGKDGHETPTGVFTILQKSRDHKSNIYNSAPMPFMQRLTWDGIALHGGAIPGHPASHGCVRLPQAFAEKIFAETKRGDTVVVSDARVNPASIAYPAMIAPVGQTDTQIAQEKASAQRGEDYWDDNIASGPVSILVSLPEQRVFVLRNGVVMGAASAQIDPSLEFNGATLFVMGKGQESVPSPLDPTQQRHNWASYPVAGQPASVDKLEGSIKASPDFMHRIYGILQPGTTILVTGIPTNHRKALTRGAAPTERILESLP